MTGVTSYAKRVSFLPFSVILLAAGGSSRLGRAKQLLPFGEGTLIGNAAMVSLDCGASEVIVVLGSKAEEIEKALASMAVKVVVNTDWAEGMASSIRTGLKAVSESSKAAVVALCDQPRVTSAHLRALAESVLNGEAPVAASSYDGVLGAPCAFSRSMFGQLMELKGDVGAREIIRNSKSVKSVPFDEARLDVDTESDIS